MKNLTEGNPTKLMLEFALPVCLGNIFQLFYSLADTRIVGTVLGESALAAVGSTTAVSTLLIGFLQGLTNGFALVAARCFGANQTKQLKKAAAGTLLLGSLTAVGITIVIAAGLGMFLQLLNVPQALYSEAYGYIQIVLFGMIITMLYNACAGILRAVGDTKAPLLFLMCAAVLNVGLDFLFMAVIPLGVKGAALGTVLAQLVSVALSFGYIWKKYPVFHLKREDFKIGKGMIKQMYASGMSMGLMMSLVFFGTLVLQCAINTFGTDTIIAHTGARKISEFYCLPFSVMGATMATFCGQNFGAGKYDRVRLGIKKALYITWVWSVVVILLSFTVGPFLIWAVTGTNKPEVIETAVLYLKINAPFYFLPAGISVLRNALQAMGDHITPVVSSFIELAGKAAIALLLTPILQYMGIIIAEPIIWILMIIPLAGKIWKHPKLQNNVKS